MRDRPRFRAFRLPWQSADRIARDVDAELQFHMDERTRALRAGGLATGEAVRRAHAEFGDVERARRELCRDDLRHTRRRRVRTALDELRQDVRHGWRALGRRPGFALVAVLTLALGIGATTTMFALVDGVLLRPLPHAEPARLVALWPGGAASAAELVRVAERARTLAGVAGYERDVGVGLGGDERPRRVGGARTTGNLFALLGARPALGRTLRADDERPGAEPVVVVSDALWQERLGGDARVVGTRLRIDGVERTVVGVMPPDFRFPAAGARLWLPITVDPASVGTHWGLVRYQVVARLAPGVTPAQARDEVRRIARTMRTENPLWTPDEGAYLAAIDVVPLREQLVGDVQRPLLVLLGAVALLLVVACVNVANLLLARGIARGREIAVRAALGAGRGRLVRQLLTESLLLGATGAAAGVLLALGGVRLLVALLPADTPRLAEVAVDGRVLGFAACAALLTSLVFGLLPALRAARPTAPALGGRGTGAPRRRLSALLVATETALAVVLVVGAGLLARSFVALQAVEPGFRTTQVVTARVSPPAAEYADADRQRALHAAVLARAATIPGVEHAALTSQLPFDGTTDAWATLIEGVTADPNDLPMLDHRRITPHYFRALGVPLTRGRAFTEADGEHDALVAIVDETAARTLWPDGDPIGRRVCWPWMGECRTVVGVVGTVRNNDLAAAPNPALYVPFRQRPTAAMTLVLRTELAPAALERALPGIVAGVDADVPVSDVRAMDALLDASVARPRLTMLLLAALAGAALLLGAIGLYGVIAYEVGGRTREIGVRMALGAPAGDVLRAVIARGVGIVLAGTAAGLLGALALARVLGGLLHGVGTADPLTFALVPLLLLVVAIAATAISARRAARIDSAVALRAE